MRKNKIKMKQSNYIKERRKRLKLLNNKILEKKELIKEIKKIEIELACLDNAIL